MYICILYGFYLKTKVITKIKTKKKYTFIKYNIAEITQNIYIVTRP